MSVQSQGYEEETVPGLSLCSGGLVLIFGVSLASATSSPVCLQWLPRGFLVYACLSLNLPFL